MLNDAEVLQDTPRLRSLYRLLAKGALEHPQIILVADSPFFIYEDGSLYDGEIVRPRYVPARSFKQGSALKYEVEIIASCMSRGLYAKEQLELFEKWALPLLNTLFSELRVADNREARSLRKANRLH